MAGRRVGDAGGVDELEEPGVGVQQVDERAVGVEQPGRLLRRAVEEPVALALGIGARRGRRRQGVGLDRGGGARAVGARGADRFGAAALRTAFDAPFDAPAGFGFGAFSGAGLAAGLGAGVGRDLVATTGRV